MRRDFLPFPVLRIVGRDIATVTEVLCSGWTATGAKSAESEREFPRNTGSPGAIALSSATAAP